MAVDPYAPKTPVFVTSPGLATNILNVQARNAGDKAAYYANTTANTTSLSSMAQGSVSNVNGLSGVALCPFSVLDIVNYARDPQDRLLADRLTPVASGTTFVPLPFSATPGNGFIAVTTLGGKPLPTVTLQLDYARTLAFTIALETLPTAVSTLTLRATGYDVYGAPITEDIPSGTLPTDTNSATVVGKIAFMYVTSLSYLFSSAPSRNFTALTVESSFKFGLPYYCPSGNYVTQACLDGEPTSMEITPGSALVGNDKRGIFTGSSIAFASSTNRLTVYQYVPGATNADIANANTQTARGLYGTTDPV